MMIHVFNIPPQSKHIGDVGGDHFDASVYELTDGTYGAYVEIAAEATDQQLGSDRMNSKIQEAAKRRVDFYVVRRRQRQ